MNFSVRSAIAKSIFRSKTELFFSAIKANRISPFDGKVRSTSSNSFKYGSLLDSNALSELSKVVLKIPDPKMQVRITERKNNIALFKTVASAIFAIDGVFRLSKFKWVILFRLKYFKKIVFYQKTLNAILRNFSKCYFPVKTSKSEARITSPSYSSFISSKTVASFVP